MEFCKKCDNMYYIQINQGDHDNLIYYCRNCGNEETNLSNLDMCVSKTTYKETTPVEFGANPYIKLDPTLPRVTNIKCPNSECSRNKTEKTDTDNNNKKEEIIYLRYDDANMKYLYLCPCCDFVWKNE